MAKEATKEIEAVGYTLQVKKDGAVTEYVISDGKDEVRVRGQAGFPIFLKMRAEGYHHQRWTGMHWYELKKLWEVNRPANVGYDNRNFDINPIDRKEALLLAVCILCSSREIHYMLLERFKEQRESLQDSLNKQDAIVQRFAAVLEDW